MNWQDKIPQPTDKQYNKFMKNLQVEIDESLSQNKITDERLKELLKLDHYTRAEEFYKNWSLKELIEYAVNK